MQRIPAGIVTGLALLGCQASKPGGAAKHGGTAGLSKLPDTSVLNRYCRQPPGPAPVSVTAMKDSAGYIGGYVFRRLILDSPVHYLDARGEEVALFHVFGSPEEKRKNGPLIDSLRAAYPVETPVECPPASTERPAGS